MKTDKEILQKIEMIKDVDWIGTKQNELISYLSFTAAKSFLKPEITELEWKPSSCDKNSIITEIKDYMEFAWDKANNCRGISASRSLDHFSIWIWMIGDDLGDFSTYEFYGKDHLVKICEKYNIDHTKLDDGIRSNSSHY